MANINSNPTHVAQIGYNGFDMSKFVKFSSSTGQILPVYYDYLNPGDKVNIKTELKTRFMPLKSGAMMSVTENIDWFFVPMTQICSWFDSWYYGIQDFKSDFFSPDESGKFIINNFVYPSLSISEVTDSILNIANGASIGKFGNEVMADAIRLIDLLGFPIDKLVTSMGGETAQFSFTPLLLQAYQKIYMDYYRLGDYDLNDPRMYNLDSWATYSLVMSSQEKVDRFKKMFTLNYVPLRKDFYTNIFPSPIFGNDNISSYPINQDDNSLYNYGAVNQWLTSTYGFSLVDATGNTQYPASSGEDTTVGMSNAQLSPATANKAAFNVANIRTIFALDKLLEITRRAGKHYDKQTLAHFGVEVPKGIAGEVFFIDHSESRVDIGDVIATSASDANAFGQIAGKGFGYNEASTSYTAPCHGILMAVYYARPEIDYNCQGVDKLNTLVNPYDFFKPEFDDLGMQPLFRYQTDLSTSDAGVNAQVLGWQYRYMELKQKYNSVHGALSHTMSFWTPQKDTPTANNLISQTVSPHYMDDVLLVPYNSTFLEGDEDVNDVFNTDPMLHQIYFDVRKASKMSTFGLPSL